MSAGVSVAGTVVHFAEAVRLLGVSRMMPDSALTFNQHVTRCLCLHVPHACTASYKVKWLRKIRKIFALSAAFGKFSSILRRVADSAQNSARAELQNPDIPSYIAVVLY